MTNKEILDKAITKIENNGVKYQTILKETFDRAYSSFIFSHDFAKAFWKDEEHDCWINGNHLWTDTGCCSGAMACFRGEPWQYHLQQMVLEEEPIKYLEKFL